MDLPIQPPLPPMLARLSRELPREGYRYEPKWDGFRCLAFRDGDEVELRSRHDRGLTRYFPEVVEGLRGIAAERFVLDGELLASRDGALDFPSLMSRLHPAASRVERLRHETPAWFVAFDLLAVGREDLRATSFDERRARLEALLGDAPRGVFLTPITDRLEVAERWLSRFSGGGIDGVVAKRRDLSYQPGKRVMVKVKRERTADCVVAGFRTYADRPVLSSILLGLYDGPVLRHVGVVTSFGEARRGELLRELEPLATAIDQHPWREGFGLGRSPLGRLLGAAGRWTPDMGLDWVPVRPERVAEIAYDQVDGGRFRHPARFRRWRLDREPRSCTFDQLEEAAVELRDVATGA